MRVNSKTEAWELAVRLFSQDYELNLTSSNNAGYPIYTPKQKTENNRFDQIVDLNSRFEVTVNGETFSIDIEECNEYKPKAMKVNIQFFSNMKQNVYFDNVVNIVANQNNVVITYLTENQELKHETYCMNDAIFSVIPA